MNIFATHGVPETSALWLDDRRRVAQVKEAAQLLSCAIHLLDPHNKEARKNLCGITHENHPVSVWVRKSPMHYLWTLEFFKSCVEIHGVCKTTGKLHSYAYLSDVFQKWFDDKRHSGVFPATGFAGFQNSAKSDELGLDFTEYHESVTRAYREYMRAKWKLDKRAPTWKKGERPFWYPE